MCAWVLLTQLLAAPAAAPLRADDAQIARDETIVQTLLRLENFDLSSSEKAKAAVLRYLQRHRGSETYFELIERFRVAEEAEHLLKVALREPESTAGLRAAQLLIEMDLAQPLVEALHGEDTARAAQAARALAATGTEEARQILQPLIVKTSLPLQVRAPAARALAGNRQGQRHLLELVEAGKLPADLEFAVANALLASPDEELRRRASRHLELPQTADAAPLPPVSELVKLAGDPKRGEKLFADKATCAKCHKVQGKGDEIGPDLSEIGSKLSPEAMYVSILDPSAGISHNYEAYLIATASGNLLTGLLISDTPESVTIKTAKGVKHTIPKDQIDEMVKQKVSLMPADLQKLLTVEDLADVVAYLRSLKKPGP